MSSAGLGAADRGFQLGRSGSLDAVSLRENGTGDAPQQNTSRALRLECGGIAGARSCAEDTDVWATLTERDAPLYREEVIEVFMDPVGDLACYFEIEVNPLNAVLDLVLRRNRSGIGRTSPGIAKRCDRVEKQADGWTAELAIPFRSLVAEATARGCTMAGELFPHRSPARRGARTERLVTDAASDLSRPGALRNTDVRRQLKASAMAR